MQRLWHQRKCMCCTTSLIYKSSFSIRATFRIATCVIFEHLNYACFSGFCCWCVRNQLLRHPEWYWKLKILLKKWPVWFATGGFVEENAARWSAVQERQKVKNMLNKCSILKSGIWVSRITYIISKKLSTMNGLPLQFTVLPLKSFPQMVNKLRRKLKVATYKHKAVVCLLIFCISTSLKLWEPLPWILEVDNGPVLNSCWIIFIGPKGKDSYDQRKCAGTMAGTLFKGKVKKSVEVNKVEKI